MTSLVRTSASGFTLNDCYTFEDVQNAISNNTIDSLIVPTEVIFKDLPKIYLTEEQTKAYRNGVKLPLSEVSIKQDILEYTIYSHDNIFIGTGKIDLDDNILRVGKNF